MRKSILILFTLCLSMGLKAQQTEFNFIPAPRIVTPMPGSFQFSDKTHVAWRGEQAESVAKFFCQKVQRATSIRQKPIRLKKEGKKQPVTENVANALNLGDKKGKIAGGFDADLVILDDELNIDTVFAMGKLMVQGGNLKVTVPFETLA